MTCLNHTYYAWYWESTCTCTCIYTNVGGRRESSVSYRGWAGVPWDFPLLTRISLSFADSTTYLYTLYVIIQCSPQLHLLVLILTGAHNGLCAPDLKNYMKHWPGVCNFQAFLMHELLTLVIPVSSCTIICVFRAMRALNGVGRAKASSNEFVWRDWVPPKTAAIASMHVRTTLL